MSVSPGRQRSARPVAVPGVAPPGDGEGPSRPRARRFGAWLIDLSLVIGPTVIVAVTQAETFSPTGGLSTAQSARIAQLEADPSIAVTLGDTLRIWAGAGLFTTGAAAALIALIVLALIPANVGGWTPGLRLFGLRVMTASGTRAGLTQHLVRTMVGIIDLAPFAIPGLLGWLIAARREDGRRLGDLAARTMVVDWRHPERPLGPDLARPARRPVSGPLDATAADAVESSRQWTGDEDDTDLETGPTATALSPATTSASATSASAASSAPSVEVATASTASASSGDRAPRLGNVPPPIPRALRPRRKPETTEPEPSEPALTALEPKQQPASEPTVQNESGTEPESPDNLVWSDEHEAWMYRDTATGRWLRHDPDSDSWLLVP